MKMLRTAVTRLLGFRLGRRALSAAAAERGYHERVLDDFFWNRVGWLDKNDPSVGTGIVRDLRCVNMTKLQIEVDDATGKIVNACHETVGCRIYHESSSLVTEWAKGKNLEEVMSIKTKEISKYLYPALVKLLPLWFRLGTIDGPEDLHSLENVGDAIKDAEFAIKAAVEDYKAKKAKAAVENPQNFGLFDEKDSSVGTGDAFACHDHCLVKFQIKVASEIISGVRYKAFGCEVAKASSSIASEMIRGKKLNEVITFTNGEIIFATKKIIRFIRVPPIQYQCVLAPIAIRAAVLDHISKK
ncbi:iron-sulfur cluster assembly protein 1-like [Zingiber officinale]|uniref:NIF system FeS cluster assembly NifU N-terminal domain-containing protein n=1 Tax=Zingiber officinale TaxID=94328 RepID=A0A8J5HM86_ZINOF|nr:iron-sulfur cluster assembly protein 1-like [Zingiber officinale]KAG6530608.1 hypothetical protein ZIOFF_012849 [Zingiber officinale]